MTRIRIILLITSAVLITAGVFNGEADAVWRKASRVCLECIGIK